MIRILISLLLANLSAASVLPEVMSYAKVSRNGREDTGSGNDQTSWITRIITGSNGTNNEGRSMKNIAITMSPVYIAPKTQKLQSGEAVDYASNSRYSTLDYEMLAKLNAKKKIQDRYHPGPFNPYKNKDPPNEAMETSKPVQMLGPISPANGPSSRPPSGPSSSDAFEFSKPPFSGSYDYKPPDFFSEKPISKPPEYLSDKPVSKPADYLADKPISKPLSMDDYSDFDISDKPKDSYKPDSSFDSHDSDYPDFPDDASYGGDAAPKPMDYSAPPDHPPFDHHGYDHEHDHDFHHELIYDHIPEYHEHTEKPEMNDQRLDKRPYSYYFIGKKLWYIPLYFSIYFIIYIAALVLKSIARHKITFPAHLAEAISHSRSHADESWWDFAGKMLEGIENFAEKYGKAT